MDENDVIAEVDGYRVRLAVDEGPEKPYDDGGAPIWRVEYRHGWDTRHEEGMSSYQPHERIAEAADRFWDDGGPRFDTLERYLRIFHGATTVERWHSGSYWYFTCDPADWREAMGITEEMTQAEGYGESLMDEWKAWCNGEVYVAIVEEKAHWRRTDSTGTPVMFATEDLRRETWEFEDSVGGLYGYDHAKESAVDLLSNYVPELGVACDRCPWMHVALDENERWDALFTHMTGEHKWRLHVWPRGGNGICQRTGCNLMASGDWFNDGECEGEPYPGRD